MSESTRSHASAGSLVGDAVGVVVDGQTYKNLLYLTLAFPLGVLYFTLLVTGLSLGAGLLVVGVGALVLLATVGAVRYVAAFERRLANGLLGTDIRGHADIQPDDDGFVATAMAYFRASSTWRAVGFIAAKFLLGTLSLIALFTTLGVAVDLALTPVFPEALSTQVNGWEVAGGLETAPEQAAGGVAGVVLGFVSLHVLNGLARVNAVTAAALLAPDESETSR